MKRFLMFLMAMVAIVVAAFAAGQEPGVPGFNLLEFITAFSSIGAVAALVLPITGWIKTLLKLDGKSARWVSWIVAVIVSIVGWIFKLGIFAEMEWFIVVAYGFGTGLIANGIFTAETVQTILTFIGAQVKRE